MNESKIKDSKDLDAHIMAAISRENPKTVKQLINSFKHTNRNYSEKEIMQHILILQEQGQIKLQDEIIPSYSLPNYIFSIRAYWYLVIIAFSILTSIIILTNLETIPFIGNIITITRYMFGSIFVLFLPGYSFIKALFPLKELDTIERLALSIGMSLALVALNALILNYSPWGIALNPITLGLLFITLTFSTLAVIREHKAYSKTKEKTDSAFVFPPDA